VAHTTIHTELSHNVVTLTGLATNVTAVTALVESDGSMAAGAVSHIGNCQLMVLVARGHRVTFGINAPVTGIVTGSTTGNITSIGMTGGTGQTVIGQRHIVVLGLIRQAGRVTILTAAESNADIDVDLIVTNRTVDADIRSDLMVRVGCFALVTGVTVRRRFGIGMTTGARRIVSRGVGVVN
jgi:hypothetical protein